MRKLAISSELKLLAEAYLSAIKSGDAERAEKLAANVWGKLEPLARDEACSQAKDFEQEAWRQAICAMGQEKFVAAFTSRDSKSPSIEAVFDQLDMVFTKTISVIILDVMVSRCQMAAAGGDEAEWRRLFWLFWSLAWDRIRHRIVNNPYYEPYESEILDEVEHKLREQFRKSQPVRHIFGLLNIAIAHAAITVRKKYPPPDEDRLKTEARFNDHPGTSFSLKEIWNTVTDIVSAIDQSTTDGKDHLGWIFHRELEGLNQVKIAEALAPPITQGEVAKRLQYLYGELGQRLPKALGIEGRWIEETSRKTRVKIFRQIKQALE